MNSVVHFEVPFDNQERATTFYKEVFGWELQDMPEMNYVIAHTGETDENSMLKKPGMINGGMYKRDEQLAKSPVLVINVPSVDDHVKKIEGAGGSVSRAKVRVGDMGYYAQVKDTEGNTIGIWENIEK